MISRFLQPLRRVPLSAWIFFLVFLLRFIALSRLANSAYFLPSSSDMKFYNEWALRIANGGLTSGQAFYGLPGYAYFLAAIYKVLGFHPFSVGILVGALQAAAEGATAFFLYQIAIFVFGGSDRNHPDPKKTIKAQGIGGIAALAWAFFQPAQTFSIVLMPTSWLALVFWGCVYWIVRTRSEAVFRPWAEMGLLIGATAMMIATILFLLPLVIWAIAVRPRGVAHKCAAISVLFTAVFIGMAPCWVHNLFLAKEPVLLSAHSGVNFYIGNNELSNGYPKMPPGMSASQGQMLADSITLAEKDAGLKLKHYEVSRYWSEKAHQYLHGHFKSWLQLMGLKFKNFWNAYQYDDLSLISHFSEDGIIFPGFRFGFIAALGLAGMAGVCFKYPRALWIASAILLHMAAVMTVFITERYRLAAAPGLCLFAAALVIELWDSILFGKWVRGLGLGAVGIASALLVSRPQLDEGLWLLDYYNIGVKATEAGELDKARGNLEHAFSYDPCNVETNFALGNLWMAKTDYLLAKRFYQRTLQLNPTHAKTWNNLGVLAMLEKRWDLADKFFAHCLAYEPNDAKTHFLAARTKLELKDVSGAQKQIRAALALTPEEKQFRQLEEKIEASLQNPAL